MVKDGELITIDGTHGNVYEGSIAIKPEAVSINAGNAFVSAAKSPILGHVQAEVKQTHHLTMPTATKIMINLTDPKESEDIASKDVDGVGLLRSEYILQDIGEHPKYLIDQNKQQVLIDAIYEGVKEVAKAFSPRPVMYRLSDFTSNQYRRLHGGEKYEIAEENPALGYRGAFRHIAESESLKLEIQAIKKVRQYYKNVWIMVPYVRTPQEMIEIKSLLSEEGLYRGGSFKLWLMAELPVNVVLIDQFIGAGIDGVSIGSNDLTQLMLGLDRHNPRVAAGFDERQEAVMWAMEKLVTTTIKHGLLCSICGQAPSAYPVLTRKLVEWGISSISVSPEAAPITRKIVAVAEFELVRLGKQVKRRS
jgi:pyruvate,water dikinase